MVQHIRKRLENIWFLTILQTLYDATHFTNWTERSSSKRDIKTRTREQRLDPISLRYSEYELTVTGFKSSMSQYTDVLSRRTNTREDRAPRDKNPPAKIFRLSTDVVQI